MILSLFVFYITFIDYYGHRVEMKVSFPERGNWCMSSHIFMAEFGTYTGLAKLDTMTGNIMINDKEYGRWRHLNYTFYVNTIAVDNHTPFKLAEMTVSRLFDYIKPVEYLNQKYIFERRFWSWNDVKDSWSALRMSFFTLY
jgi:hypothetical protein